MVRPTAQEVEQYAISIGLKLSGEYFVDFYTSKGWCVGKSPMKDWKACVRTWKRMAAPSALMDVPRYDPEKIEKRRKELEAIKEKEWARRNGDPEDWEWTTER